MKLFWPTILLILTSAFNAGLLAQTNQAPASASAQRAETHISSERWDFNNATREAVYQGKVFVDDPEMKLWCEKLTVITSEKGKRVERIVAETNVVVEMLNEDGQTNRANSDKLVYTYNVENSVTNDTVELTGNPQLETPQGKAMGEVIIYDRITRNTRILRPRMTGTLETRTQTNMPAVTTTNQTPQQ